jgi:hypothetical protein
MPDGRVAADAGLHYFNYSDGGILEYYVVITLPLRFPRFLLRQPHLY